MEKLDSEDDQVEWVDVEDISCEVLDELKEKHRDESASTLSDQEESDHCNLPVINNLKDWIASPWMDVENIVEK